MIWSIVLVSLGCTSLWLAAKHWWGWVFNAATEVLWFVYALTIHAIPLALMAIIWGVVNVRNAVVTYRTR